MTSYPAREIVVRDARGERRLAVYGEFRGKLIARNIETNRLSYIRPNDPRIQKEHHCARIAADADISGAVPAGGG